MTILKSSNENESDNFHGTENCHRSRTTVMKELLKVIENNACCSSEAGKLQPTEQICPNYVTANKVLLKHFQLFMYCLWLLFCDCGFHYVQPLTDKDNRLTEAS